MTATCHVFDMLSDSILHSNNICSLQVSFLCRVVESVQTALASQALMSVLDLTMLATQNRLASVLEKSQATPKREGDQDSQDPPSALCFCLSMAQDAYISAQLLDYSIGTENMSHITVFTNDLTVGLLLKGPKVQPQGPDESQDVSSVSQDVSSGSNMNDQASSLGLSITFPVIQLDFSSVSTAKCQRSSGTVNELLSFDLSCTYGTCIPLVQLSVSTISVTVLAHLQKSRVMSELLTFSDISKEDGHIAVEQTYALSDVVVSAELKLIQCHIIHTLYCYPNIIQHMDTIKKHCSQYVLPAIQSTSELLETVAATHTAGLCSLLLSAASQSGRFLPKVSTTTSPLSCIG